MKKIMKKFISGKNRERLSWIKAIPMNLSCFFHHMNDEIILESYPDLTCNSYALYKYMLKQEINKEYKLTWLVNDPNKYLNITEENVEFICINPKTKEEKKKFYRRCNRAIALITSNRHIGTIYTSKKQLNIYLDHGSQMKSLVKGYGKQIVSCDYLLCQSEFFIEYNLKEYVINRKQIFVAGLPRNDQLFQKHDSLKRIIPDIGNFKKIIVWVPTFRQHMSKERNDCNFLMPLGIPIIYDKISAIKINEALINENVILIIKPHPAQDMSVIKKLKLENIRFIYNEDLELENVQLNEFLAQTDAMITDYSSVYYDYLLTDKPIAITLDDYNEYRLQKGFVFDEPLDILKGDYIYDLEDFVVFIENVSKGIDNTLEERLNVKNLVHQYTDDNSSKRVYDFIMEKLHDGRFRR